MMSKINLDNTIQKIASTSKDIFIDYLMEEKKEREKKIEAVIEFIKNCGQDKVFADATIIKMLEDLKNETSNTRD